jgi:hypothetical protein
MATALNRLNSADRVRDGDTAQVVVVIRKVRKWCCAKSPERSLFKRPRRKLGMYEETGKSKRMSVNSISAQQINFGQSVTLRTVNPPK